MFQIEEELKKLPGKTGCVYYARRAGCDHLCGQGDQSPQPCTAVFSEQPQQGSQDRADGHPHIEIRIYCYRF